MTAGSIDDNIAVGVHELDGEHSVQIGLLKALRQALVADQDMASANAILQQLSAYTNAHFMAEQLLMRLHAYPNYDEHLEEHNRLIEKMQELEQRQEAGEVDLTVETIDALGEWVLGHTKGSDRRLGSYLREHGAATGYGAQPSAG